MFQKTLTECSSNLLQDLLPLFVYLTFLRESQHCNIPGLTSCFFYCSIVGIFNVNFIPVLNLMSACTPRQARILKSVSTLLVDAVCSFPSFFQQQFSQSLRKATAAPVHKRMGSGSITKMMSTATERGGVLLKAPVILSVLHKARAPFYFPSGNLHVEPVENL